MARLSAAGAAVHVVIATRPMAPLFNPALLEDLQGEAAEAHNLLGIQSTHFCEFPAAELDRVGHSKVNAELVRLIDELQPDTLFIPFAGDLHLDHQLIFLSSMVAARPRASKSPSRVLAYETLSETNWLAPGITPAFVPNLYVDISTTLDAKVAAFERYASQVKQFPDERSIEAIRALAQLRGATVYRRAAEAFVLIRETVG